MELILKAVISSTIVQLPILNHAHSMPLLVSISRDSGTLFTGFMPMENTHSGEAFNPCPLTAPSLPGFPLYMDMFCIHSSFLLAALSAAQQGTKSLLIGTYLGKGRNPIFLNNPYSLPLPSSTCEKLSSFSVMPIFSSIVGLSIIPLCRPLRWTSVRRTGGGCIFG